MATVPELCYQLNNTKAKYMFTVPALVSTAKEAAKQCGITEVFVVGEAEGCQPISELFKDDGKSFPKDIEINPKEDVAILPFSSGTTGLPKGVMLTHFNITANIQQFADRPGYLETTVDEKVLSVLPFFHIYGFTVILGTTLYKGATIVSLPKFEPELFLETIQNVKVSFFTL
jgi:acyl-CoA synthetase (AMP-forming)/AMP-acid ligase II